MSNYNTENLFSLIKKLQQLKIIDFIRRNPRWNDYPKLYQYTSFNSKLKIGGSGFDFFRKEVAIIKSISEFIEIYSLTNINKNNPFRSNYEKLKNKTISLNDLKIPYFDKKIEKQNLISENEDLYFTTGFDLLRNKKVFIPAHLIYFPVKFKEKKLLREPNSNGTATHTNLTKALIKSILELIERDAFFIYYLNNSLGEIIEIDDLSAVKNIIKNFEKYRIKIYIFYQPTDIKVFNITSIGIDESGLGIIVGVGSCSDINLERAIIKSLIEVSQILNWGRTILTFYENKNQKFKTLKTIENRAFFWSDLEKVNIIRELIEKSRRLTKKPIKTSILRKRISKKLSLDSHKRILAYLLDNLSRLSMDVYYSEITPSEIKKLGFVCVKSLIPQLQPVYLSEKLKQINLQRLKKFWNKSIYTNKNEKLNEINKIPHFFF